MHRAKVGLFLMRWLAIAFLLVSCGSVSPQVAGSWSERNLSIPGSGLDMTLLSDGGAVAGTGVAHIEAGADQAFTVSGKVNTPAAGQMTFLFANGTTEDFAYTLPDADHLTLTNGTSTIPLLREE
jgi:hypothetical protein